MCSNVTLSREKRAKGVSCEWPRRMSSSASAENPQVPLCVDQPGASASSNNADEWVLAAEPVPRGASSGDADRPTPYLGATTERSVVKQPARPRLSMSKAWFSRTNMAATVRRRTRHNCRQRSAFVAWPVGAPRDAASISFSERIFDISNLRSLTEDPTLLKDPTITPCTKTKYAAQLQDLVSFTGPAHFPHRDDGKLDSLTANWTLKRYVQEYQPTCREILMASWMHHHPVFSRHSARRLPRSWKSVRGWRRRCSARSREPVALWWTGIAALPTQKKRSKTYAAFDSVDMQIFWAPWLIAVCEALAVG